MLEKWRPRWSLTQLQDWVASSRRGRVAEEVGVALNEALSELRVELQSAEQDAATARSALESAQRDAAAWHQRFDWVTNSLSWRLTRPLRDGKAFAQQHSFAGLSNATA